MINMIYRENVMLNMIYKENAMINIIFQVNIGQSLYRWYGHETLHHPIVNGLVVYATSSGYRARMNR